MKILVFDPDESLRELLRIYLVKQGHEVAAFPDPKVCPIYGSLNDVQCTCPRQRPCGDVVIIDNNMPNIKAIDFLRLQRRRGCRALDANKAVMSANMTPQLEELIAEFGCHYIRKPFRLTDINGWVGECRERLARRQTA